MSEAPAPPPVANCEYLHPVLSVSDLPASIRFYADQLGFSIGFTAGDPIQIAGMNMGFGSLHLRRGTPSPAGAAVYLVLDDVDALYEHQRSKGVAIASAPSNKPWGLREYQVQDRDGYTLTFGQHVHSTEPKIEVERVAVTVPVEKRLAALLNDLAGHKRMSVGEVLEETILHSFEQEEGGGVASPHSKGTHRYIQQLKATHGIDYDAHDAYRFIDKP
jgi:catechol 2,3-dioxygenase-like lactoylglutathione lyase family enzyme